MSEDDTTPDTIDAADPTDQRNDGADPPLSQTDIDHRDHGAPTADLSSGSAPTFGSASIIGQLIPDGQSGQGIQLRQLDDETFESVMRQQLGLTW